MIWAPKLARPLDSGEGHACSPAAQAHEHACEIRRASGRAPSRRKLLSELKMGAPQRKLALASRALCLGALCLIFMQATCLAQQIYRRRELTINLGRQQALPSLPPLAPPPPPHGQDNVVAEMQVFCHSDSIVLMVNTNTPFNGMLYARDAAASGPNCLTEIRSSTNMTFRLPLKSCGTLMAEVDDGVEFFNTIVVQPHMRLMTNQGKGYHVRCKYQTRERTIANTHFNVSAAFLMQNGPQSSSAPLLATASMPMCTMKIYRIDQDNVAESVRVGDKLVMVIEIDKQDMYGMRITNCVVRDGMNKAEQQLISDAGCPVDEAIMPKFEYEHNSTRAAVAFRAHKFPHTSSIYYQCNVRLCINSGGGCEQVVCPAPGSGVGVGGVGGGGGGPSANSGALSESPSAPVAAVSGASVPAPAPSGGGPRRKRFIGHKQAAEGPAASAAQTADDEQEPAPAADDATAPAAHVPAPGAQLPEPSELKLPADMSFDVYSGLYVSDVDMSESDSGDPNGQQVLPAPSPPSGATAQGFNNSTAGPQQQPDACLTMGRAGLLVVAASLASVGLVLLVACQAGMLSANCSRDDERGLREFARELEHQQRAERRHARACGQQGNAHAHAQHAQQQQRAAAGRSPRRADEYAAKGHQQPSAGRFSAHGYNGARLLSSAATSISGKSFSPFYPLA